MPMPDKALTPIGTPTSAPADSAATRRQSIWLRIPLACSTVSAMSATITTGTTFSGSVTSPAAETQSAVSPKPE